MSLDIDLDNLPEGARERLKRNIAISKGQPGKIKSNPERATLEERRQILDEYEMVAHGGVSHRLHPIDPETGDPLCYDFQGSSDPDDWLRRTSEQFHAEHVVVCQICSGEWRKIHADGENQCSGCGTFVSPAYLDCPECGEGVADGA